MKKSPLTVSQADACDSWDYWMITNNSTPNLELIAEGNYETIIKIENNRIFELMKPSSTYCRQKPMNKT